MIYTDHLETPRLITRFLTEADTAAWMEYCSDPEATAFTNLDDKPAAEMAQAWVDRQLNRYAEGTFGVQALIDKEYDELVGMCGLIVQEVNGEKAIEIGYHLLRKHWGKGYAAEAAKMFRDYGFENNIADALVSIIHPDNIRSKKVAERNGMHLVETNAICRGKEYNLFRITRAEWEQLTK